MEGSDSGLISLLLPLDYSAAILAVVAGIATANWYLYARRHYQGPRIQFQD